MKLGLSNIYFMTSSILSKEIKLRWLVSPSAKDRIGFFFLANIINFARFEPLDSLRTGGRRKIIELKLLLACSAIKDSHSSFALPYIHTGLAG